MILISVFLFAKVWITNNNHFVVENKLARNTITMAINLQLTLIGLHNIALSVYCGLFVGWQCLIVANLICFLVLEHEV